MRSRRIRKTTFRGEKDRDCWTSDDREREKERETRVVTSIETFFALPLLPCQLHQSFFSLFSSLSFYPLTILLCVYVFIHVFIHKGRASGIRTRARTSPSSRRNASKDYKAREIFSGHGRHNSATVARFIPRWVCVRDPSGHLFFVGCLAEAEPPASVRTMDRSRNMDAHLSRVMLMRRHWTCLLAALSRTRDGKRSTIEPRSVLYGQLQLIGFHGDSVVACVVGGRESSCNGMILLFFGERYAIKWKFQWNIDTYIGILWLWISRSWVWEREIARTFVGVEDTSWRSTRLLRLFVLGRLYGVALDHENLRAQDDSGD